MLTLRLISQRILLFSSILFFSACSSSEEKDEVAEATHQAAASQDAVVADDTSLNFNFHIRPILSDKCFFCHGPDEKNNKANFRLDTPEAAYAKLKDSSHYGIVPGDPAQSAIWDRITTNDPKLVMPPIESKRPLSEKEKSLIKRWIEEGAEYQDHWAFQALPKEISPPELDEQGSQWVKNKIDHFIYQKAKTEGLSLSPEATAERWLRRATLDLIGLPPTSQEVAHFRQAVTKNKEQAYEQTVDRLLATPAYGEHRAVSWLDAVRYADSYGYQTDQLNNQWPYRDWVIRAFNSNMPYNTFLTWNIAGDLLENATQDQKLASAYNRLHRLTNEGGSIPEEFLVENAADRLHTFGTSTMALTMECSRCHDHKYDPISARDYYSLMAFFNSTSEHGLYDNHNKVPSPTMLLPNPNQQQQLTQLKKQINSLEANRQQLIIASAPPANYTLPNPLLSHEVGHFNFEQPLNHLTNLIPKPQTPTAAKTPEKPKGKDSKPLSYTGSANGLKHGVGPQGPNDQSILFNGDRAAKFYVPVNFERHTPFSIALHIKDNQRTKHKKVILHRTHGTDVGPNGYDIVMQDGHIEARLYRVWPGNGIGVRSTQQLPVRQWQHLTWTYDGSSSPGGMRLYLNGHPIATKAIGKSLLKSTNLRTTDNTPLTLGERMRDKGFTNGEIDNLRIFHKQLSDLEILSLINPTIAHPSSPPIAPSLWKQYYATNQDPAIKQIDQSLLEKRQQLIALENRLLEVAIMDELHTPRPTYILERGEYSSPKKPENKVTREVFESIMAPFPKDSPRNRLGLAQWLTDKDHPLTSRVFINRLWQQFFGTGIVATPENFGIQAAIPSHPDLLNWLSRDFVSNQWDIKRICKQIVLSATYRQASALTPELREKDPQNRFLARGPSYRLSAEQIRDLALFSSGLMHQQVGGYPAYPYSPGKDHWRATNSMSPSYRQAKGKDLYRRSIYSVWKRTAPLPNMMAFDATSREVCAVSRERTNTPLQALVLLNDIQFLESARNLASQLLASKGDLSQKINEAFIRLTGKSASSKELELLKALQADQLAHYQKHTEDAVKLITQGDSKPPTDLNQSELAAMTIVCQAILNLDATIWKR